MDPLDRDVTIEGRLTLLRDATDRADKCDVNEGRKPPGDRSRFDGDGETRHVSHISTTMREA